MRYMLNALCAALALAHAEALLAAGPAYPTRPVRLVVPYAPGGGSDITARMIGQKLGERLGQSFVIDTRPGAASLIGTEIVAKAAGDGYTLILADVPHAINAVIFPKPPYDAVKDFSPITHIATTPQVLVAHPSFKAGSLKELIAMPRAQTNWGRAPGSIRATCPRCCAMRWTRSRCGHRGAGIRAWRSTACSKRG